jgi:hypothetical protein
MINPKIDIDERNDLDTMTDAELDAYEARRAGVETGDDEPADIDSDEGFDPYTGGPESSYEGDAGDWYGED